jgi:hypothetical protein
MVRNGVRCTPWPATRQRLSVTVLPFFTIVPAGGDIDFTGLPGP